MDFSGWNARSFSYYIIVFILFSSCILTFNIHVYKYRKKICNMEESNDPKSTETGKWKKRWKLLEMTLPDEQKSHSQYHSVFRLYENKHLHKSFIFLSLLLFLRRLSLSCCRIPRKKGKRSEKFSMLSCFCGVSVRLWNDKSQCMHF